VEKIMDWSTYTKPQLKAEFIPLRNDLMDCQADINCSFSDETEQKYFSLLEYIEANYGSETLEDWQKEADRRAKESESTGVTGPGGTGNGKKVPVWAVVLTGLLFFVIPQILSPRTRRR
jgi:hypothetical protein